MYKTMIVGIHVRRIPLEPVFSEESIPPMSYNIVKDDQYCGEIKVGLTFTAQVSHTLKHHHIQLIYILHIMHLFLKQSSVFVAAEE